VPGWRIHDLRRTFETRLRAGEENEAGETTFAVPLDVIQATVNHKLTAEVTEQLHGIEQKMARSEGFGGAHARPDT
jgi:hypothetical protein